MNWKFFCKKSDCSHCPVSYSKLKYFRMHCLIINLSLLFSFTALLTFSHKTPLFIKIWNYCMCRRKSNQTISDQRTTTNRCKRIISKHCDDSGIRKHYQLFFHLVLFGIICNVLELQIVAMPINVMESFYWKYRISYAF